MRIRLLALVAALLAADYSDASTESNQKYKKRIVRQTAAGCALPEQPTNGKYLLGGCDPPKCRLPAPGTRVQFAVLNYTCEPGFKMSGSPTVFCDAQWLTPFPTCVLQSNAQMCSPLTSSSHEIYCSLNEREVRCSQPMSPQTKAVIKCKKYFEGSSGVNNSEITCDRNGLWSQPLFSCTPECGVFNFKIPSNGAENESPLNIPWYAAVMKKDAKGSWQFACSATIISPRTLVSGAQCVWKEQDKKILSADNFGVLVGKYEHGPKAADSKTMQQILVKKIYLTETFRGYERRYSEDISLFILKNDIIVNEVIHPICVDYDDKYASYFVPGKEGIIGSWGEPIDSTYKQKIISIPIVDFEECLRNIPPEFHSYLTNDKFCAGTLKKKTVCIGDSGVGFANQFKNGKWYLTGIASVGVSPSGGKNCEINYFKGFTRVSLFLNFIKNILAGVTNNTEVPGPHTPPLILCKENEFQCASSECVKQSQLCDGMRHCSDGTDETYEKCHLVKCAETLFRCRYGACIDKTLVCNGKNECEDGSDEESTLCKKDVNVNHTSCSYPPSTGCKLPKQPQNGYYTFIGCKINNHAIPDSFVPAGVLLNFSCNPGFTLSGPSLLACYDDWSSQPPSCDPVLCKPLQNPSRDIKCIWNNEDVDCVRRSVKPGTRASVKCNFHYESLPGLQIYDLICEANGKWNGELQSCVPKCGIPNPHGAPLISHGQSSKVAEFPWHVGFYTALSDGTIVPSCGGSIVSARVIVSAAHCFWKNGEISFLELKTVAGKYYYKWEKKINYVQHLEIQEVVLPENYKGPERHFENDIALIILKNGIKMNEAVRPVCVDYELSYLRYFSPGYVGNVTGWGRTETQTFNEVLNVANLPYVNNDECEKNTPVQFHTLLTNDKFCAGNINKTTVCDGDSGGGYTVRFRDGRSYLVGIVSIGPDEACGTFSYVVFTNVFRHVDFIRQHVFKYV